MADSRVERPRFCSQCGSPVVVADASFCKNCGAPLASTVWFNPEISWNPRLALALSIIPGLGHWYKGQRVRGLLWFIFVILLYSSNAPTIGILLHVICASNAGLSGAIREEAIANPGHLRRQRVNRWNRRHGRQLTAQPPGL
jgi:hypothetical protein